MDHFHLTLTSKCNQNCIFCLVKEDPSVNLTHKDALSQLKKARSQGATLLSIDGGEPTVHPHFKEIVRQSIVLGFKKIAIKTNGLGFSDFQYAKDIIYGNQNIIKIYLSLHGADNIIHDKLSQNTGSFDTACRAIKNIIRLGCDLNTNIVICNLNFMYLKEYVNLLNRLKVRQTIFLFVACRGNALKYPYIIPKIETTVPFIEEAIDLANSKDIHIGLTFFPFCLFHSSYIDNMVESKMIGNIKDFDGQYNEKYKSKNCQKCRYYSKCSGVWREYYRLNGFKFNPVMS